MPKKKTSSYREFLDRESRNPHKKDIFLYFCDYKKRIKDGKCTVENCRYIHRDIAVDDSIFGCKHTTDEKYAKNSSERYFEPIPSFSIIDDKDIFIEVSKDDLNEIYN